MLRDFIGLVIGSGQLGALLMIAWRAGAFVQAFKDHMQKDAEAFSLLGTRLGNLERKLP